MELVVLNQMKHYLNQRLKGKLDQEGRRVFPVYAEFTVFRQTYQIRSRIIRRMLTPEEFDRFYTHELSNKDKLFEKDMAILNECLEESIANENQQFNFTQFKGRYAGYAIRLDEWFSHYLNLHIRSSGLDIDLPLGSELTDINDALTDSNLDFLRLSCQKYNVDISELLNHLLKYSGGLAENRKLGGLLLAYDWHKGPLQRGLFKYFRIDKGVEDWRTDILRVIDGVVKHSLKN